MHDLLINELGPRRVHWRYDDPSGLPDADARTVRAAGRPVASAAESRVRVRRRPALRVA